MRHVWTCQRDGACCREPDEVVMTHAERVEIERAAPSGAALFWQPHADARFVRLTAKPCPLLVGNTCAVYAVRPVNCRRYGCGREDVTTEPYVLETPPVRFYRDRPFRRQYLLMRRDAMTQWGHRMGWERL